MSRFAFFNRSNTIHASSSEESQKPFNEILDRSGSLSRFYGSVESMKSSIRGRMVKKLCNLFESSPTKSEPRPASKLGSEPRAPSRLGSESRSASKLGSESGSGAKLGWESGMLFRLEGGEERIVVYLTSLRGIRRTFEDCNAVKMILKGFRIWVDERDVSMDRAFRKELQCVMGEENVSLPQVFIRGKYIGGADVIKHLFESGDLKRMLEGFPKMKPGFVCESCGDARFVPCENCSGSRKIFDEDEGLLKRCLECNENGLTKCPSCSCY
ncbi:uncharacterized protein At5g39865 [Lathyrus oleraceus]|uniref:Glutaredoxin domain-containing protein n=1 Tax=Pisum sativum TaxID=3888 RepID=A0A9D4WZM4_PEA|nr:uncharacterized protein At5g39865-like [Pisum sativum]XP_050882317.1 uncharacterized protein At5g39865-like [Pisum sativum]KAI5410839.1 hypothetical protein KIW84_056107 [Pisum sativum]